MGSCHDCNYIEYGFECKLSGNKLALELKINMCLKQLRNMGETLSDIDGRLEPLWPFSVELACSLWVFPPTAQKNAPEANLGE